MKTSTPVLALALLALVSGGCTRVQAKAAMKDGNKDYKEENFKRAVDKYQRAVELDPNFSEAWFYLGSSHQAQFRPGKETPDNKEHLELRLGIVPLDRLVDVLEPDHAGNVQFRGLLRARSRRTGSRNPLLTWDFGAR